MIATQDITYGVTGQSLILDCEDGPIASVTSVQVRYADADDTAEALSATTGSASVDSTATTTTAAAGASEDDPTLIALTSASGFAAGRVYRLSGGGLYEDIEILGISGANATVRNPLINDYASGATLTAMRATVALDSTFVASLNYVSPAFDPNPRYRVRWLVVVAGATQVYDRYFDLVRYPARHGVVPMDLERRFPGWLDGLPTDARKDQGRSLIDRAFVQLKFDLYQDGKADQAIRNAEAIAELTIARAMLLVVEDSILRGGAVDPARYDVAKRVYEQRYDSMLRAPVLAVDTTGGGASQPVRPRNIFSR